MFGKLNEWIPSFSLGNTGWLDYNLLFDTDVVIFLLVFIAVIWCVATKKLKPPVSKFNIDNFDLGELLSKNNSTLGKKWKKYRLSHGFRRKRYNKHEEKCREIFEKIYRQKFESVRPDFLKNPTTNKNLELDGFCPYIVTKYGEGIAFEYDGVQHSKHTSVFHRKKGAFEYQCAKDAWKDKRCKDLGITLIRIPHFIVYDDLEKYIIDILRKKDVYIDNTRISKHTSIAQELIKNKEKGIKVNVTIPSFGGKGLYD